MPSTSLPRRVYARTPAKLNLFLELLSKRSDGYHEIETVMTAVNCYDTLRIDRSDSHQEIRLKTHWYPSSEYWITTLGEGSKALLAIPNDQSNLIHRGIAMMRDAFGITSGFDVTARKRAPAGAGMGGASSDAAAAILAVAALAGIRGHRLQLQKIAASIGSDVPFFLGSKDTQTSGSTGIKTEFPSSRTYPQAALAKGRGELLSPFALTEPLWFVVAYPPVALSTAAVYRVCEIPEQPVSANKIFECLTSGDTDSIHFTLLNRLSRAAQSLSPLISDLLSLLSECCQSPALMTGSGSACFCICPDRNSANRSAEDLRCRWAKMGASGHVMVLKTVSACPQLKACW